MDQSTAFMNLCGAVRDTANGVAALQAENDQLRQMVTLLTRRNQMLEKAIGGLNRETTARSRTLLNRGR